MKEFKLPDLGEGVHEGQVMRLLVSEGELVNEDQHIMEVETDKAAVEIPSPVSGKVHRIHVEEKQLVHVGDVMFTFQAEGPPIMKNRGPQVRNAVIGDSFLLFCRKNRVRRPQGGLSFRPKTGSRSRHRSVGS